MSQTARVSVIVLHSAGRDQHLCRALTALFAQRTLPVEVIVVSSKTLPLDLRVTWVTARGTNIAARRNAGVAASTGELIAFCDDDAAAEPNWLSALSARFADARIGAAGGPVLGPDGIRQQWGETRFDADGIDRPDGAFVKLNGTNMMIRRAALDQIGGFDPHFAYYLDETDVLARITAAGWRLVWEEAALVHHATATNAIRGPLMSEAGFRQMGNSMAMFCRKHLPETLRAQAHDSMIAHQKARLLRRFQLGRLDGAQLRAFLGALRAGVGDPEPMIEPLGAINTVHPSTPKAEHTAEASRLIIATRLRTRKRADALARIAAQAGWEVTLIKWRYLRLPRKVRLGLDGIWRHTGGVFARATRDRNWSAALRRELQRIEGTRAPNLVLYATYDGGWRIRGADKERTLPPHAAPDTLWKSLRFALAEFSTSTEHNRN